MGSIENPAIQDSEQDLATCLRILPYSQLFHGIFQNPNFPPSQTGAKVSLLPRSYIENALFNFVPDAFDPEHPHKSILWLWGIETSRVSFIGRFPAVATEKPAAGDTFQPSWPLASANGLNKTCLVSGSWGPAFLL